MNIIRPELKGLHSPDVYDLDNAAVNAENAFCILVQAMFGPAGSEGEESFDVVVCNPKWVEKEVQENAILNGRHHLIMSDFNIGRIRNFLLRHADQCAAPTWEEVGQRLGRIGHWEFEDYDSGGH
jgi:hypothetical protein